jgi:monoamine oxidase
MKKIAIIGGGLSGIYAALLLERHYHVTLFEAHDRLGGRIYTVDGFDLGPSWVWAHQKRIVNLIRSLDLEIFSQYEKGQALYETPGRIERFTPPSNVPSGRIKGGVGELIDRLKAKLTSTTIYLNKPIRSLCDRGDDLSLHGDCDTYIFDEVIIALPPRLIIESLSFDPPLSSDVQTRFTNTPTWMGHSAKCVIEFESPFWREMGLSGFCFSHFGPMGEIHDACIEGRYALFGFINTHANMATIEEDVRRQCQHLFGKAGENIFNFYCVEWRKEPFTAVEIDAISPKSHPNYGLNVNHFGGKVHFIGTETSFEEGGYLEGAIASAQRVFQDLCYNQ